MQTPAQSNSVYAPKRPATPVRSTGEFNPSFHTTAQEYGKYAPNAHTRPYSYHGLSTRFTANKTREGNYRNHSFNL